jgi:hypothetical protein
LYFVNPYIILIGKSNFLFIADSQAIASFIIPNSKKGVMSPTNRTPLAPRFRERFKISSKEALPL